MKRWLPEAWVESSIHLLPASLRLLIRNLMNCKGSRQVSESNAPLAPHRARPRVPIMTVHIDPRIKATVKEKKTSSLFSTNGLVGSSVEQRALRWPAG